MKVYAISDLHLSFQSDKPMDLFGGHWTGYEQKILDDWNSKVGKDDVGIIAGDISWAMKMDDTVKDFEYLKKLNGTKIIIRGNHDYWWKSISRIRETLAPDVLALQNDSVRVSSSRSQFVRNSADQSASEQIPHSQILNENSKREHDGGAVFAGTRGWKVPERYQTPTPDDKKIFDREVVRLELALADAQKKQADGDKLIAIMHYPPFNSLRDDSPFTKLMEKFGVAVCIYGHLHGKGGRKELLTTKNGVKYYLTSCDLLGFAVAEIDLCSSN